jgi:hypothetical protein
MRERYKRIRRLAPAAVLAVGLTACSSAGSAQSVGIIPYSASPATSTGGSGVGYDISNWQCSETLPADPAFGIVQITAGVANKLNQCLREEAKWAQNSIGVDGIKEEFYIWAENPGNRYKNGKKEVKIADWPDSGTYMGKECDGTVSIPCSFLYGFNKASKALKVAKKILGLGDLGTVYNDVEVTKPGTDNWQSNQADNAASIKGFITAEKDAGVDPGLYSDGYQWNVITGGIEDDLFAKYPEWYATGNSDPGSALGYCSQPFINDGQVVAVQYVRSSGQGQNGADYDQLCPAS